METPAYNIVRHVVTSHGDSLVDTRYRYFGGWKAHKNQLHMRALFLPPRDHSSLAATTQSRLEGEIFSRRNAGANHLQHHPSGLERRSLRLKRVQIRGNQVGVDEGGGVCFFGRYSVAKVVFPAPLGPAMMMIRLSGWPVIS